MGRVHSQWLSSPTAISIRDTYWSGQGFRREQDWLGRNGYVALHVDYRNHARSDKDPKNDVSLRLGYAEDVIGAALAVEDSEFRYLDRNKIALLGRSMGGGVAFQALVMQPGVFDAAITYASTSTLAADNFNKWTRNMYPVGKQVLTRLWISPEEPESVARHVQPLLLLPSHRAGPNHPWN